MHPALQEVYQSFGRALANKPAEWCQLHPCGDERHWSAQELIEHLVLVSRSTRQVIEKRLERGRVARGHRTILQRVLQIVLLRFGRMPRGTPAPPFARPDQLAWPSMNGNELLEILRQEMDQMDRQLDECRRRFGSQRAAAHFLLGAMSADQWRRFHEIHFRHHLQQLDRIEKAVGQTELMRDQELRTQI